ncbi:TAXI family TRAP transporter solute-binding subunit [Lawsonibacter hominis]|uniref:TAXI family TRAP transporter solute-binding subunit n=1 Tax=Lawsonibacter hominis TaxID=2763053 RepID=UPI003320446C
MKKFVSLILAAVMVLALAACGNSTNVPASQASASQAPTTSFAPAGDAPEIAPPASPAYISLGSGSSGGNFYVVGGGVATVLNNELPEYMVVTSEETGGSTANLVMLQNGDVEFGVSMTSSMAEAVKGEAEWTGGPMDKLRGMIALYPSYLTIYTPTDSGITCLNDLSGHIVGLGSKGAAMDTVWREIFQTRGINPSSIFNDGHGATATAMADGQIDAAILYSLPPFAAITELEASKALNFIGLTDEEQESLVDTYSFYSKATLPAGSYKGVTEDLPVVSEWNMLCTSTDVDEDIVYLVTKTLIENSPALQEVYDGLSYVTAENILNYNIPLHAGTVRYLKEVGIDVPASLIPPEYKG